MIGYLGLGSNLGDRHAALQRATAALSDHGVRLLARSSLYETEPVGLVPDQPGFLNACLRIETELGPEPLLDVCKQVEREVGRSASGVRHGPRAIDVDLLLLGDLQYSSERLTLPHRDLHSRRFVLVPLLELDPELRLGSGARLADALAALSSGQAVRRVAPPLPLAPQRPKRP